MKQLNAQEFLALFDPSIHEAITRQVRVTFPDATHMVCFEDVELRIKLDRARTAVVVGPANTFKSPADCEGKWLNDLPSQRQYPVSYVNADELRS